ncbi:LolA-related protein [Acidihalobacter yilgarnensis]|uniref:LolA-related protein n=1 Tax=Acidihalobacter yilgarnensis TaxID=2819280 RepID=UPI0012EA21E5|nr:LolA-related protein [Acidihalobacter yilgarnensis]
MTTGNPKPVRSHGSGFHSLVSLFCLGILLSAQPAFASGWTLTDLLQGFARITSATARYTETRSSSFVDIPLISRGHFSYRAPDYLAKRAGNGDGGYIVRGNEVEVLGTHPPRQLHLDDYPPLAALVAALRATLSGDASTLHRYFDLRLSGSANGWRLQLTPTQPALAQAIRDITLHGIANRLTRVDIRQANGDHSELTLSHQVIREQPHPAP